MTNHTDRHSSSQEIDSHTPYVYSAKNLSTDREARIINQNGNIIILILDFFLLPVTCFRNKRKSETSSNTLQSAINYLHRKGYDD